LALVFVFMALGLAPRGERIFAYLPAILAMRRALDTEEDWGYYLLCGSAKRATHGYISQASFCCQCFWLFFVVLNQSLSNS